MKTTREQWLIKGGALIFLGIALIQLLQGKAQILPIATAILYYCVLYGGYRFGPERGAVIGILFGVAEMLIQNNILPLAAFALGGMLSGAFRKVGRIGSVIAFACGIWGMEAWYDGALSGAVMAGVLTAGVLFLLTPEGMLHVRRPVKIEHNGMEGLQKKRLEETADSYGKLANSLTTPRPEEKVVRESQAISAMERSCSMVCGGCHMCRLGKKEWDSMDLLSLCSTFQANRKIGAEDLPEDFQKECRRKDFYLEVLGDCLGSEEYEDGWKSRFFESREAASLQFREIQRTLKEMAAELEEAVNVTAQYEKEVRQALQHKKLILTKLLVLQRGEDRLELFLTLHVAGGKCVTVREVTDIINRQMPRPMMPEEGGRTVVGRESCELHFTEKPVFRLLSGVARAARTEEEMSGDTFSCHLLPDGRMMLCLSDGMGSGRRAFLESRMVVDFMEDLMDAGFSAERAIYMLNALLVVRGEEDSPTTMDLGIVDLYTGQARFYKQGAVSTFIEREQQVIQIEPGALPLGIDCQASPAFVEMKLQDGDRIVMVTDGVLDAMAGEDKEQAMCRFLSTHTGNHAGELAEAILEECLPSGVEAKDDMTVLVGGLWMNNGPQLGHSWAS